MARSLVLFGVVVLAACASPAPAPAPAPKLATPAANAEPATQSRARALAEVHTTDPMALASLLASVAASSAAWRGPPSTGPDPAEAGLRKAAERFAPGLRPEGDVAKALLTEGSHASFTAELEPSKCYAIVAYAEGATDLDVSLLLPPFFDLLVGQDGTSEPAAVVGAAPRFLCPVVALPSPYKVDLYAKKGSGRVAAQLYSKPR